MHTFLPFSDYRQSAKSLHLPFLYSTLAYSAFYFKSLMQYYPLRKKDGFSGLEGNTIAQFWKGHEREFAKYALTLAQQFIASPLSKSDQASSFAARKRILSMWEAINELVEEMEFPEGPPVFVGDEEFHAGFRSFLLLKGCEIATFRNWKKGVYPDHVVTRGLLPKKKSWKREDYHRIWEVFGRPDSFHYGELGWEEEPDDLKYFYTPDREPHMVKEIRRKKEKPVVPFLARKQK